MDFIGHWFLSKRGMASIKILLVHFINIFIMAVKNAKTYIDFY